ncbi:hypothetical protein [Georgenia sp. AZ-5]|uniref:hypothetical protein n=1 Tax=Georgenia sp. AZ-5 TaxID=3367526 RepID=UPI003754EFD7
MTLPYAVHRIFPMSALAVGLSAVFVYSLLHFPAYPGINAFVLLLGVALHSDRRRALIAFAATVAVMMASLSAQPASVANPSDWVATTLMTVVAYLLGENWRLRRVRWSALRSAPSCSNANARCWSASETSGPARP